jgi:hypothetical protein
MCIMHMMPGPSCDGEFIHSFIAYFARSQGQNLQQGLHVRLFLTPSK